MVRALLIRLRTPRARPVSMPTSGIDAIPKVCMSTPTNRSRTRRRGFLRHLGRLLFFSLLFLIFSGIGLLWRGRRRWIRLRCRRCLYCFRVSQTADARVAGTFTVAISVATAHTRPRFVQFYRCRVAVPIRVPGTTPAGVSIIACSVAPFRAGVSKKGALTSPPDCQKR